MADRFSDGPQSVDPVEAHINYSFGHLVAVGKQGKAPGEIWYPKSVAIDSNTNQIYIAEGTSYNFGRVSIFSETGEFLNSIKHKHMNGPWGIAIYRDNLYVTDRFEQCVFHFKLSAGIRLVARLGGYGSGIGKFIGPRQLSVSTNGDVFVTDCRNDRIQILDSSLHYQRHISHPSMSYPCDVKLTPEEVYVLSSRDSPCVHVFSYAGDKIRSLITCGHRLQVTNPLFFCLDVDGNLIIRDWNSYEIRIFSKKGTLLQTLENYGHEVGMFYNPQGLAFIDNFKLVIVSESNCYRLQIFSC